MIRTLKRLIATDNNDNKEYVEIACLSTDSKPTTGIITGSVIYEVDTGKRYEFNEVAGEWVEQPASGGGGLPPVETTDKDKYLHTNAETGDLEWSEVSGGGLVIIPVTQTYEAGTYYYVNANYTLKDVYDLVQSGYDVAIREQNSRLGRMFQCAKNSYNNNIVLCFVGEYGSTTNGISGYIATAAAAESATLKLQFISELSIASGPAAELTEDNGNLVASGMTSFPTSEQKYYTAESVYLGESKHWYSTVSYYHAPMSGTINIVIKDEVTGDLYHMTSTTQPYTFTPYTP